jgi:hypothetical protein
MATIIYPVVVMIVGLLLYGFSTNPKLSAIGKDMFVVGLFWTVYLMTGRQFHM